MRSRALLRVAPLALLAAACGSTSTNNNAGTTASSNTGRRGVNLIKTQRAPGVGAVVVNGTGRTVYIFTPEKGGKIKCTGTCASTWPLLVLPAGEKPATTSVLHPNLVGTVKGPTGAKVITYAGWPLHTYSRDPGRGSYLGQGVGGQWFMISPSGSVITRSVSSSSSTSSGGY